MKLTRRKLWAAIAGACAVPWLVKKEKTLKGPPALYNEMDEKPVLFLDKRLGSIGPRTNPPTKFRYYDYWDGKIYTVDFSNDNRNKRKT
jgi:hypothetical protein